MITSQNHLLYAFTVILLMASSTSSKLVESFLSIREGVLLKGHPLQWQRTTSFFSCAHLCLRKEGCRYINYKASTETEGVCELLKDTSRDHNNGYIDGPGWFHGQIVHSRVSARTGSNTPDFKFTFTTLGAVGSNGPIDSYGYKGTTLQGKIKIENGIQLWTVPLSGSYVIEAWGASGAEGRQSADVSATTRAGGKGAYVRATFVLTRGKVLKILVGQTGCTGKVGSPLPGGGGGGTFITSSADVPLIIAGGGGGGVAQPGNFHEGDPGQTTRNGSQAGGSNGSGGNLSRQGSPLALLECGAGGGLNGNGKSRVIWVGGKGFINGGRGGNSPIEGHGGFGGGGAAWRYPGAGGGYSGGGVVKDKNETIAGGGGSFNTGANPKKEEGLGGDGKVIIQLLEADKEFV